MNFNVLKALIYIAIILGFGLIFSACTSDKKKKQTINFYRESTVKETLKAFKEQAEAKKDTVQKSASGMIIYKDNSYQNHSINQKSINFGPKDPNFDIKIKF